jgi:prephenate dehydratase
MSSKVSIQGGEGSFHHVAAEKFFGARVQVLACPTFREVVRVAENGAQSDGGVMAIENSIAGSILPNYGLLQKSSLAIVGEVYLKIGQHLLVNPGVDLDAVREVHSHPMALLQCLEYLDGKNWKLVETEDTALSARHVQHSRSRHIAAIAGRRAAQLYGLDIIASNIHNEKNNYTRFLVLQRAAGANEVDGANKASITFTTDHATGSLARVLTAIAKGDINLSKLQSFPVPGTDWKYSFHADLEFDNTAQFHKTMQRLGRLTQTIRVFGIYKKGITH